MPSRAPSATTTPIAPLRRHNSIAHSRDALSRGSRKIDRPSNSAYTPANELGLGQHLLPIHTAARPPPSPSPAARIARAARCISSDNGRIQPRPGPRPRSQGASMPCSPIPSHSCTAPRASPPTPAPAPWFASALSTASHPVGTPESACRTSEPPCSTRRITSLRRRRTASGDPSMSAQTDRIMLGYHPNETLSSGFCAENRVPGGGVWTKHDRQGVLRALHSCPSLADPRSLPVAARCGVRVPPKGTGRT